MLKITISNKAHTSSNMLFDLSQQNAAEKQSISTLIVDYGLREWSWRSGVESGYVNGNTSIETLGHLITLEIIDGTEPLSQIKAITAVADMNYCSVPNVLPWKKEMNDIQDPMQRRPKESDTSWQASLATLTAQVTPSSMPQTQVTTFKPLGHSKLHWQKAKQRVRQFFLNTDN